jgi:hypothetical protein
MYLRHPTLDTICITLDSSPHTNPLGTFFSKTNGNKTVELHAVPYNDLTTAVFRSESQATTAFLLVTRLNGHTAHIVVHHNLQTYRFLNKM